MLVSAAGEKRGGDNVTAAFTAVGCEIPPWPPQGWIVVVYKKFMELHLLLWNVCLRVHGNQQQISSLL